MSRSGPPAAPFDRPWSSSHLRLWSVRFLALVSGSLSAYLAWVTLANASLAGCSSGGVCDQFLASRWSWWFNLPVSLPAASVYFTLFSATLLAGESAPANVRNLAVRLSHALALGAGLAAVWFLVLMYQKRAQSICPYCLAIHLCGLAICGLVFWRASLALRARLAEGIIGGGLFALLLAGQYLANPPQAPYARYELPPSAAGASPYSLAAYQRRPDFKSVTLARGRISLEAFSLPTLGSADARQTVAIVLDYTCGHCRHLARELEEVRSSSSLAVILIPVGENPEGTELARLALLVYFLAPDEFAGFHAWLIDSPEPRSPDTATQRAAEIVGRQRLEAWLGKGDNDSQLRSNLELAELVREEVKNKQLPKLLLDQSVISGAPQDAAELTRLLRQDDTLK